jgi:hypothetical protein
MKREKRICVNGQKKSQFGNVNRDRANLKDFCFFFRRIYLLILTALSVSIQISDFFHGNLLPLLGERF